MRLNEKTISVAVAAAIVLSTPTAEPLFAQVAWDAPMLLAPGSPGGLGVFLIEPAGPDASGAQPGLGFLGTWRRAEAPAGVGVRLGWADNAAGDPAVLAGLDVSGTLSRPTEDFPVGSIWVLGAGISAGDDILLSFPAGISASTELGPDGILFRPYLTPHVALDVSSGPGDVVDLSVAVDLGLDLVFSRDWVMRFALSLGSREAIAVGLGLPAVSF